MLSRRATNLKPSPTLALAAKAKDLSAQGHDVISLSVGEPDWDTYEIVKQAAIQAIRDGLTKYVPSAGIPELRKAIAQQVNGDLSTTKFTYTMNNVTVTAGGKFVIFSALQMLCDPDDEVLIPAPYWVSYPTMAELADARPVIVETAATDNYKLTGSGLRKAITAKTKVLILNSPSNPAGTMYSAEELHDLAVVLRDYPRLVVLSDDIYNRLVFNERGLAPHILEVAPDLVDRTVIVNGASKSYSMTGWRVGWGVGPEAVIRAMTDFQSQSVSCAAGFAQKATLVALQNGDDLLSESISELRKRRDEAHRRINALPGVSCALPEGAFYLWPDISAHFGTKWRGHTIGDSREFAQFLLDGYKVAAVPGYEFGMPSHLRLSYALNGERMTEALDRMAAFLAEL